VHEFFARDAKDRTVHLVQFVPTVGLDRSIVVVADERPKIFRSPDGCGNDAQKGTDGGEEYQRADESHRKILAAEAGNLFAISRLGGARLRECYTPIREPSGKSMQVAHQEYSIRQEAGRERRSCAAGNRTVGPSLRPESQSKPV